MLRAASLNNDDYLYDHEAKTVLHTACETSHQYSTKGNVDDREVQDAIANVMAVFKKDPSAAQMQNSMQWDPRKMVDGKWMSGMYAVQYMFSYMPSKPSGYSPEQFESVLNATGDLDNVGCDSGDFDTHFIGAKSLLEFALFRGGIWNNAVSSDMEVRQVLQAFPDAMHLPTYKNYYQKTQQSLFLRVRNILEINMFFTGNLLENTDGVPRSHHLFYADFRSSDDVIAFRRYFSVTLLLPCYGSN